MCESKSTGYVHYATTLTYIRTIFVCAWALTQYYINVALP